MRQRNSSFIIQIVVTYFLLIKYEITGIVFKPGKSFKKLEHDMDSNYNALSRILQDSTIIREKQRDFECKQEWPDIILKDTLICYCKDNEERVEIYYDPGNITPEWEIINDEIIKNKRQDHLSSLYLINCSFAIGNNAIEQLKLTKLSKVYIAGSGSLDFHSDSLSFTSTNVTVTLFQIHHLIPLPKLHTSVSTLVLEEVYLRDFSTDNFIAREPVRFERSLSMNTNIVIKNSRIQTAKNDATNELQIGSITFDKIKIEYTPRNVYINLIAMNFVKFKNMVIEPGHTPLIRFVSANLVFDDCELKHFSTEHFLTGSQNILIRNGEIIPPKKDSLRDTIKVNSFALENVKFKKSPRYPFINLNVTTSMKFKDLFMEASNENMITFMAKSLIFENCTIRNWREKAIVAIVDNVSFINTKLQEPQKHALMHLGPLSKELSILSLVNVTLDDPAEGTLATGFRNVYYDNIRVERCKCDLVQTLLAPEAAFARKLVGESVSTIINTINLTFPNARLKMEEELNKHIVCHPRSDSSNEFKWVHPKDDCNGSEPIVVHDNRLILSIMVGLVVTVSMIGLIVLLCWRRKVKEKAKLIEKWKLHPPKQPKAVDRTEMSVRYLPGVEIESDLVEFEVEMRNSYAPDIVRDTTPLETTRFYDSLKPNNFLRVSKSIESLDESQRGSVIIHEDIDDEY